MKKKFLALLIAAAAVLTFSCTAFAANTTYSKWMPTEFSGQTDFGYFYTYTGDDRTFYPYQETNYKCFSVVSADGQRFYAALKEPQYEYAKAALDSQEFTISGLYQQNAEDGSPIFMASNIITTNEKGEKTSTPLGNVVWETVNHGTSPIEIFNTFSNVYSDYTITVADDGSYLMIDTNPNNYKGNTAFAETGLDHIEKLNKALGLPDWLYEEMLRTRALDGRQKEDFDNIAVTWSYHPDQGMEVIYRTK